MAKVHPNLAVPSLGMAAAAAARDDEPVTLTVWRKSLLFNCRGFTVFDASGNLVYRVDIYASDSRAEVVLMDAAGRPVLTVRRKKAISLMGDQWLGFPRGGTGAAPQRGGVRGRRGRRAVRGGGVVRAAVLRGVRRAAASGGGGAAQGGGGHGRVPDGGAAGGHGRVAGHGRRARAGPDAREAGAPQELVLVAPLKLGCILQFALPFLPVSDIVWA
uniref:Protein LURP-one-related 8 n=1 Tax=Aegilops tauschii TaxID=37682 RepID=R7WAB6_AEGTA